MPELDWTKPEDYAYTRSLTRHQWAWEFLRRNPEYRKDWNSLQERIASAVDSSAEQDQGQSVPDVNMGLAAKWDLYALADPNIPAHEMRNRPHFRYTADVSIMTGDTPQAQDRDGVLWVHWPYSLALRFNVLIPVEPQLEVARKILLHWRRKVRADSRVRRMQGKPQPAKFPLYVRLLDARLAGLSELKIGLALFKTSFDPRTKAHDAVKAARRMASSGYRDLLLTPDTWHRLEG